MLYLRNSLQQQSLGKDIQRGITNICCTPTLNSVTSASFTQLTINSTFGTYLVNCKSCVGGYIQVTENSGSTWTTINPGNCSPTNLVPMPSQSAYYRLFTSCSSVTQPFDPLTSSFSNEIFYVPNSRLNYKFTENVDATQFKLIVTGSTILDASSSVSGTFYEIPSASAVSASVAMLSTYTTGSTSMSLSITGSNVNYSTSSCATSGTIFIGNYKAIPNQDYYVTASVSHRPENSCGNVADLGYIVTSFDDTTKTWWHANEYGVPNTTGQYPSASLVGASTAVKTNVVSGDCRYNAIQFSGSMTLPVGTGSFSQVYLSIVTGSFTVSGTNSIGNGRTWAMTVRYENTGSIEAFNYKAFNATTKNALVGLSVGVYIPASQTTAMNIYVSGSLIANNPPEWSDGPVNFGTTLTLTGQGIIRGFGLTQGNTTLQSQYDCIYETTASKS
jgi:hypothetical protein